MFVDIEKQQKKKEANQEHNREILSKLAEEIRNRDTTVQTPTICCNYPSFRIRGSRDDCRYLYRQFLWTLRSRRTRRPIGSSTGRS